MRTREGSMMQKILTNIDKVKKKLLRVVSLKFNLFTKNLK